MSILARNVRRLREAKGWTQADLELATGLSSVAMIESGARTSPRGTTLQRIADALGVGLADLYRDEEAALPNESLEQFLSSPFATDVTESEKTELRKVQWPFGSPSIKAWYHLLEAMRATSKD